MFNKDIYPNNSIIELDSLATTATTRSPLNGLICVTDRYPCCSNPEESSWFLPSNAPTTVHSNFAQIGWFNQSKVLYRNGEKYTPSGLFLCRIKDSSDSIHWLYIGIYLEGLGLLINSYDVLVKNFSCEIPSI